MKVKGESQPELIPNEEEQEVNLEHVLPDRPEGKWPTIDPDVAEAYYNRLGNMVLLQAKKNSIIGNSPFSDESRIRGASPSLRTAEGSAHGMARYGNPRERQKRLAKYAVDTWPLT